MVLACVKTGQTTSQTGNEKEDNPMPMLTLLAAAEELDISITGIRRLISNGELKAYRVGKGAVRIKPEDLEKVLKPIINERY
jgi:excisionase family DNA binding protein